MLSPTLATKQSLQHNDGSHASPLSDNTNLLPYSQVSSKPIDASSASAPPFISWLSSRVRRTNRGRSLKRLHSPTRSLAKALVRRNNPVNPQPRTALLNSQESSTAVSQACSSLDGFSFVQPNNESNSSLSSTSSSSNFTNPSHVINEPTDIELRSFKGDVFRRHYEGTSHHVANKLTTLRGKPPYSAVLYLCVYQCPSLGRCNHYCWGLKLVHHDGYLTRYQVNGHGADAYLSVFDWLPVNEDLHRAVSKLSLETSNDSKRQSFDDIISGSSAFCNEYSSDEANTSFVSRGNTRHPSSLRQDIDISQPGDHLPRDIRVASVLDAQYVDAVLIGVRQHGNAKDWSGRALRRLVDCGRGMLDWANVERAKNEAQSLEYQARLESSEVDGLPMVQEEDMVDSEAYGRRSFYIPSSARDESFWASDNEVDDAMLS